MFENFKSFPKHSTLTLHGRFESRRMYTHPWFHLAPVILVSFRFNFTDFPPFEAYGVQGWWLDNLLKDGKLERSVYLRYAAKVTVGFQKRLADCRAAERLEHNLAIQAAVDAAAAAALQPQLLPIKTFPQVEAFIACHDGQACFRRPILAIVGGTRLGKSLLAADVLRRVGDRLNLPEFVEVTVEASKKWIWRTLTGEGMLESFSMVWGMLSS